MLQNMELGLFVEVKENCDAQYYKDIKESGFSHIDFNMANTNGFLWEGDEDTFKARLLKQKQYIEEAGMSICQVHGPWRWPPQDATKEDRAERMEKMKQAIRGTAAMGCKYCVIHPLMPYGIYDKDTPQSKETLDINREFMRELLRAAKESDVIICLENMPMPKFTLGSPREILAFVKEMNDEHFKICLDTGHVAVYPELDIADAIRELADEICVFHIHDNNGKDDLHMLPFQGVIDWKAVGKALEDIEFKGIFSFETVKPVDMPEVDYYSSLIKIAKEILMPY